MAKRKRQGEGMAKGNRKAAYTGNAEATGRRPGQLATGGGQKSNRPEGRDNVAIGCVVFLALILLWLIWFENNIEGPYRRYSEMLSRAADIALTREHAE